MTRGVLTAVPFVTKPAQNKKGDRNTEKSDLVTNKDTKTVCANSKRVQSDSSHPLGMALSGNMVKKIIRDGTKSSLTKHTSSEMEYNPREPYELPSKNQETKAAEYAVQTSKWINLREPTIYCLQT